MMLPEGRAAWRIACVIIPGGRRTALLEAVILPSVLRESFDEVVVAGSYHDGAGYRHLPIPDFTKTTNDALIKRDVGALVTRSDVLVYLADDHRVGAGFAKVLADALTTNDWDVLVPHRFVQHPSAGVIPLTNGFADGYCGGHGGVFRRWVVEHVPWCLTPHVNWDLLHSKKQQLAGAKFAQRDGLDIWDVEPNATPWR